MGRRLAFTLPGWVSTQSCSLWQQLWGWAVSFMDTRLKKPARGGTPPHMSARDTFYSFLKIFPSNTLSSVFKMLQQRSVRPWNRRKNCDVSTVWPGMQFLEVEQHLWSLQSESQYLDNEIFSNSNVAYDDDVAIKHPYSNLCSLLSLSPLALSYFHGSTTLC